MEHDEHQLSKFRSSTRKNVGGDYVTNRRRLLHDGKKFSKTRRRRSVGMSNQVIARLELPCLQNPLQQDSSALRVECPHRFAYCCASYPLPRAFVRNCVAPPTSTRRLTPLIASVCNRTCPGDCNYTRTMMQRRLHRDHHVADDHDFRIRQYLPQ